MACPTTGSTRRWLFLLFTLLFVFPILACGDVTLFEEEEEEEEIENSPPVADLLIEPTMVRLGTEVLLDGSASSDADQDSLTYQWTFMSLPALSPLDTNQFYEDNLENNSPTFTPIIGGVYTVQLVVSDEEDSSEPVEASLTASLFVNNAPTAVAGSNRTVRTGNTIQLDGSGSTDPDCDSLRYTWSFVEVPLGSLAVISAPGAMEPTFDADLDGNYKVQLVVRDYMAESEPSEVEIEADPTHNDPPVADAGENRKAMVDEAACPAQLDGSSSSDPNGDGITYSWSFTSVPSGSAVDESSLVPGDDDPTPTFVPDVEGNYRLSLTVTDDFDPTAVDRTSWTTASGLHQGRPALPWRESATSTTTPTTSTSTTTTSTSTTAVTTSTSSTTTTLWNLSDIDDVTILARSDYTALACFQGGEIDFTPEGGGITDSCFFQSFETFFSGGFSASADLPPGDPLPSEIIITFADPIGPVSFQPTSELDSEGNEIFQLTSTTAGPFDIRIETLELDCTVLSMSVSGTITPTGVAVADLAVTFDTFVLDESCAYQTITGCEVSVTLEGEESTR